MIVINNGNKISDHALLEYQLCSNKKIKKLNYDDERSIKHF